MNVGTTLSACIVLYNSGPRAAQTVRSFQEADMPVELFVVDNAPGDSTMYRLRWQCPGMRYFAQPKNVGYGQAHNHIIPKLTSTYHIICNPDVTFSADLLTRMVEYMELNRDCVILTPRVFYPNGQEQFLPKRDPRVHYLLGGRLEKLHRIFYDWRSEYTLRGANIAAPTRVEFAPGCFMMIRTNAFRDLHGFDPRFFLYHEDSDLSRRARSFGNVIYNPEFAITHDWTRSSAHSLPSALHHIVSTFRYFWKWGWRW